MHRPKPGGTTAIPNAFARRLAVSLGLLALSAACGPVEYIHHVTRKAASEVAAARSAGADRYAPYEYTSAVELLHKAREEEGYADHQAAIRFGRKATEMAMRARKRALARAGKRDDDGAKRSPPVSPETTPASPGTGKPPASSKRPASPAPPAASPSAPTKPTPAKQAPAKPTKRRERKR